MPTVPNQCHKNSENSENLIKNGHRVLTLTQKSLQLAVDVYDEGLNKN